MAALLKPQVVTKIVWTVWNRLESCQDLDISTFYEVGYKVNTTSNGLETLEIFLHTLKKDLVKYYFKNSNRFLFSPLLC